MDQVIVRAKLDTLRYRVERVEACVPERYEDLIDNPDAEDLVVHNFNQAAQACVDLAMHAIAKAGIPIPHAMADAFDTIRGKGVISEPTARAMKGAVHIRNITTRRYAQLDLRTLHTACTRHLGEFRTFAAQIGQYAGLGDKPLQGDRR